MPKPHASYNSYVRAEIKLAVITLTLKLTFIWCYLATVNSQVLNIYLKTNSVRYYLNTFLASLSVSFSMGKLYPEGDII